MLRQGDKTLTEAELNTHLEQMLDFHVREAELERTYYLRCRSTLPADKLVRLPMVCKDFARRSSSVTSDSTRLAPSLLS